MARPGLARAALPGGEVELDVGVAGRLLDAQRGPAEVGVQEHPGGVHHAAQEQLTRALSEGTRSLRVAGGDGLARGVDQERCGEADVRDGAGQRIDGGRSGHERQSRRKTRSVHDHDRVCSHPGLHQRPHMSLR